jgi:hypothetical protein
MIFLSERSLARRQSGRGLPAPAAIAAVGSGRDRRMEVQG